MSETDVPTGSRRRAMPALVGGVDRGAGSASVLTAEEFGVRFSKSARVLWAIAAGVLGDPVQAEDVLQDSAVIGLQKLSQYDPDTPFTTWMGRVVRFVALNQLRRGARRRALAADPAALESEASPDTASREWSAAEDVIVDGGHFDDELAGALKELKPIARACLILKTVLELEYSEISAALGVPPGTAMSHVHRARRFLREQLSGSES